MRTMILSTLAHTPPANELNTTHAHCYVIISLQHTNEPYHPQPPSLLYVIGYPPPLAQIQPSHLLLLGRIDAIVVTISPSPARTLPLSLPAVLPAPSHGHLHYPASGVKDVTARTSHYNAFLIASSTDDDPYQSPFSQRMRIRRRGRQSNIMARLHPLPPPSPPQEYTETFSLRDHLHKQMFAVLFYVVSKQTLGAL